MNEINIPKFKKVVVNESIAIGGMIALGKSTLTTALAEHYGDQAIFELSETDEVQKVLLKSMYEGKRKQSPSTFQVDFLLTRSENYEKSIKANHGKRLFFDRTIFEDLLFAHQNMADKPYRYDYYRKLWNDEAGRMLYTLGVPKLYLLLDAPYEVFLKRLFDRSRSSEIDNYEVNEDYFKLLHKLYVPFLVSVFEEYGINYKILDATKTAEEVFKDAVEAIDAA